MVPLVRGLDTDPSAPFWGSGCELALLESLGGILYYSFMNKETEMEHSMRGNFDT